MIIDCSQVNIGSLGNRFIAGLGKPCWAIKLPAASRILALVMSPSLRLLRDIIHSRYFYSMSISFFVNLM
jgi:hypothetical protein